MKVLITVKTYPIPSAKHDELVCTAGVRDDGSFVRLYPINFRDLPFSRQYKKYQWIEVEAAKHKGRDARKESYRPNCDTIKLRGEPIPAARNWAERAKYVLARRSDSMEHLHDQQEKDRTSLGIFKPKKVHDLVFQPDSAEWKPSFKAALAQARLWEDRKVTKEPPRKVPFKFQYVFRVQRFPLQEKPPHDDRGLGSGRLLLEQHSSGQNAGGSCENGAQEIP